MAGFVSQTDGVEHVVVAPHNGAVLEFWPHPWDSIWIAAPFAAMAYVPAHVAVQPDGADIVQLLALQVFWIAVLGALAGALWTRGIRRALVEAVV